MSVPVPFPALRPDTLRTLVVVGDDGEVAVALRDVLPRSMVIVLDARPGEAAAAAAVCLPYPWAVVLDATAPPPRRTPVARRPTLVLARTGVAAPAAALRWSTFRDLASQLRRMLGAHVGGMRLAPGMGVELPDGSVVRSAPLQALLSAHPAAVPAPPSQFRTVAALLRAHTVGWTAAYSNGAVTLVADPAS